MAMASKESLLPSEQHIKMDGNNTFFYNVLFTFAGSHLNHDINLTEEEINLNIY